MRLGWRVEGFSELDLIEFRDTLMKLAPNSINVIHEEYISIKQLLGKKFDPELISKILVSIITGALVPISNIGENICDIVLLKLDVLIIIKENA